MKFIGSYFALLCCVFGLLFVQARSADLGTKARSHESVRGYLVDTLCVKEEAAQLSQLGLNHTRKCIMMPACRESGYALLLPSSNNDVLRFDKHGNDMAAKFVNEHRLESGWLLRVTGKRTGDQFAVATLELVPQSATKPKK